MLRNRLAVTRLLIALLVAIALVFLTAHAALAQQPDASTKAAPAKPGALPTQTKEWKGDFYPAKIRPEEMLKFYADHDDTHFTTALSLSIDGAAQLHELGARLWPSTASARGRGAA